MKSNSTRRDFVLRSGAVLGAGVATATTAAGAVALRGDNVEAGLRGTAAGAAAGSRNGADGAAEREAIRHVHRTLLAHVEKRDFAGAAELFAAADAWHASGLRSEAPAEGARFSTRTAYRQTSTQLRDDIALSEDGASATARFHVEAEVCTPIQGDCTAAQMARLQGNVASRHWESGRFDLKLAKTQGHWRIVSLTYERAPSSAS
jgi:hypothetical protein